MVKLNPDGKREVQRVVIVGGGAGGLVLATRLAKQNKRLNQFDITLVDSRSSHVWKPILHEVAAGQMNAGDEALSYYSLGARDGYVFQRGSLKNIDRVEKWIEVENPYGRAMADASANKKIPYDILVLALGGVTQDFGIPGVKDHCYFLDSVEQAELFYQDLIEKYFDNYSGGGPGDEPELLQINIVGGGATGVELAMALSTAIQHAQKNSVHLHKPKWVTLRLIEAGEDILSGQEKSLVDYAKLALSKAGVELILGEKILEAKPDCLVTSRHAVIVGDFNIWVGGVRGPEVLAGIEGILLNDKHQIQVNEYLQSCDSNIYAIGDCALCFDQGAALAPRAQVAQQQAEYLAQRLVEHNNPQKRETFHFVDHGLFVSLDGRRAIGTLNAALSKQFALKGRFAGCIYAALYQKHYAEMAGPYLAFLKTLKHFFGKRLYEVAKSL